MSVIAIALFLLLPKLQWLSVFVFLVSFLGVGLLVLCQYGESPDVQQKIRGWFKPILLIVGVSGLSAVILPTRQDMAIIIAGSYLTNIEGIGEVPENIVKQINEILKPKE